MNIFKFSVGSEAKRVAVRCVFAIGVVLAEEQNLEYSTNTGRRTE